MTKEEREKPYPNYIRYHIKQRGYTIQDFADKVGIPRRTLTGYISGIRPVPRESLKKIARHLGCSLQELIGEPMSSSSSRRTSKESEQGIETMFIPAIEQNILFLETGSHEMDTSRRQMLQRLLSITGAAITVPQELFTIEPWERLSKATTKPSVMNVEAFNHFQSLLKECWGLSNNGEMKVAEQVLSSFLPKIIQLAPSHSNAAILAAEGLRLLSIFRAHQMKLLEKVALCQQAVDYARLANDYDITVAELTELAVAFEYSRQPECGFKIYQEALAYADQASPLISSRFYGRLAIALAYKGRTQEADFYIGLAYANFPEHPEVESNFLSSDHGLYKLAHYKGLIYLAQGKPKEAERAFESFKEQPSGRAAPERSGLEILNDQGRAAIMSNDLEKYTYCLEEGIAGAITLCSKKRFDEAFTIYQQEMPKGWLYEPRIKQIAERFQLYREVVK